MNSSNYNRIYIVAFILACLAALYLMSRGWSGSLVEIYGFRQTQTAISAFYMLKGSDLIRYQTPVYGPPWTIPFEFPFYQIVVFLLVKLTGYGLDQAGRLISALSFISALYPLYMLSRPYFTDKSRALIPLILLCISPQYIYWSRTFMIESTALALSVWYLFIIRRYFDNIDMPRNRNIGLVCILIVGILAAITKVTTFFVYLLIGAIFVFIYVINTNGKGFCSKITRCIPLIFIALVVPVTAIIVWTHYSDEMKSMSAFGSTVTSESLRKWNFGTLAKRLSLKTWSTIFGRDLTDLFGNVWMIVPMFALLPFCRKRAIITALILSLLFVVPFAVFTNLHYCHSYYVYANGILLILAVAVILGDLSERGVIGFTLCLSMIMLIAFFSYRHYLHNYLPFQGSNKRYSDIKLDIDKYTTSDDILVFHGAGWSSEMPYYLQRKALMIYNVPLDSPRYQIAKSSLSSYRIGAVAVCDETRSDPDKIKKLLVDFLSRSDELNKISYETCNFYFRNRINP